MKKIMLLLLLINANGLQAQTLPAQVTGIKTPESVLQAPNGIIYISEINEFDKDGDGQISKIDSGGKLSVFAKGMDDPKGLVMVGDKLYVADKARVLEVDAVGNWRVFVAETAFPSKPKFLNDLAADSSGNLYISESGDLKSGGAIYKIDQAGKVSTVVDSKNPDVLAPNGLVVEGQNQLLSLDFASGILYRVNITTGKMTKLADGFGGADGLVKTKAGKLFVSDWQNGFVYEVIAGKAQVLKGGFNSPADIALSADGKSILVPVMKAGTLDRIELKE